MRLATVVMASVPTMTAAVGNRPAAAEIGHTTTKVPGRGFTYERIAQLPPGRLPEDGDSTLVRWTMTGILGSNYSFRE